MRTGLGGKPAVGLVDMGQGWLAKYERFLRIDQLTRTAERVRARVVYSITLVFIVIQLVNVVSMAVNYGGLSFQHLVSLISIAAMIGLSCLLRITQSRWLFGVAYGVTILGCVLLAVHFAVEPLFGRGVFTPLFPILIMGPVIVALVSNWKMTIAYTLGAIVVVWHLFFLSRGMHAQLDAPLINSLSGHSNMGFADAFDLFAKETAIQGTYALLIVSALATPFGAILYGMFDDLEDAALVARDAEAAKGDFLAQMSHEIRTPLNGIIAMSDMLCAQELPERADQQAEIINTAGQQLMEIVNDVLDHARLEAGRLDIHAEPFDLYKTLHSLITMHTKSAEDRGIWLGLDWQDGLPHYLVGDQKRLRQVVNNFVSNAIKFTDVGGVKIGVRGARVAATAKLQIFVQDTGQGISKAMQDQVFERFVQSESGSRQGNKGTGLGLAITKQLTELMGGTVSVSSIPGQGSVFVCHIELPVADDPQIHKAA